MATLQVQARALGDPTRYELFRYVAEADRAVDVAELTEHVGLNHNAVRQHLAKLVDAELVVEAAAQPAGRGRPRLEYRLHPQAESRWDVTGPYERLSMWLAEVIRTGESPVEVGRRAGRRHRLGQAPPGDSIGALVGYMARQGFDPAVRARGGTVDVILRQCPFASTASYDPDTVCGLHLGIAYGVAEGLGGIEVESLVPKEPHRAHCRLRCRVESPA